MDQHQIKRAYGRLKGQSYGKAKEPKEGEPDSLEKIPLELLRQSRSIVISEEVSRELAKVVIPQLLWLDSVGNDPIKVLINSPGGGADDGFAIFDTIRLLKSPVFTLSIGVTASAGALILLAAPKKNRLVLPNARLMIHQPAGGAEGMASDIEITAKEIYRLRRRANNLIATECEKPLEQVEKDTNRDHWFTPEEACEYGLCSRIVATWDEI